MGRAKEERVKAEEGEDGKARLWFDLPADGQVQASDCCIDCKAELGELGGAEPALHRSPLKQNRPADAQQCWCITLLFYLKSF